MPTTSASFAPPGWNSDWDQKLGVYVLDDERRLHRERTDPPLEQWLELLDQPNGRGT
ncbi:hypothetical protein ACXX9E_28860 [Pseudomonas sp. GNP014]